MARRIELFYDVVSPYSYIAFDVLTKVAPEWKADLVLRPFFLGGVMQATGNRPPGMLPAKGKYLFADMQALIRYYGLPALKVPPSHFPTNTVFAQRVLTAVAQQHGTAAGGLLEHASRALWHAYYLDDLDIGQAEVVANVMHRVAPDTAEGLLAEAGTPAVKDALRMATEEAVERGCFGAPSIFVNSTSFYFGSDRFHLIAHELGVPFPTAGLVTPSSARL